MVGVDTDLGGIGEFFAQRVDAIGDVAHGHGAAGVHDVDAGGAVAFHERSLVGQGSWGGEVAHHEESDGFHAEFSCSSYVLGGDVGFGAVRGYAHDVGAGAMSVFEIVHSADAGQQQGGDLGVPYCGRDG
ncbi:Uncharacterised protein [Mycobacteroides abscessus subsp. abscessus]|nr:Uncharacterised protein [Mycobacteroides abscessus subsp. abscessus]